MSEIFTGTVEVQDGSGQTTLQLDGNAGNVTAGGNGHSGTVSMQDAGGSETVQLNGAEGIVRAGGIVRRETNPDTGKREGVAFGVMDPAAFAVISGPSIAETMLRQGVAFRRADNTRRSTDKRAGGWDQLRARLKGNDDGHPLIFFFSTCRDLIRTLPIMQHDENQPEDLDSDLEDHAVDQTRYACMARPYRARDADEANRKSIWLVANAFRLHELRD